MALIELDAYEKKKIIYEGQNKSRIMLVFNKSKGKHYILKELKEEDYEKHAQQFLQAVTLQRLQHPNILPQLGFQMQQERQRGRPVYSIYMLMDFIQHSLADCIQMRKPAHAKFRSLDILQFIKQSVSLLKYLQLNKVAHRDIKPHNFLVNQFNQIFLIDFQTSWIETDQGSLNHCVEICGTPKYFSPEMGKKFAYGKWADEGNASYNPYKSDVYSFGLSLLEMCTLSLDHESHQCAFQKIKENYPKIYPDLVSFLELALQTDPDQRPDPLQLRQSKQFRALIRIKNSLGPKVVFSRNCQMADLNVQQSDQAAQQKTPVFHVPANIQSMEFMLAPGSDHLMKSQLQKPQQQQPLQILVENDHFEQVKSNNDQESKSDISTKNSSSRKVSDQTYPCNSQLSANENESNQENSQGIHLSMHENLDDIILDLKQDSPTEVGNQLLVLYVLKQKLALLGVDQTEVDRVIQNKSMIVQNMKIDIDQHNYFKNNRNNNNYQQ